jgi:hypothetical protein
MSKVWVNTELVWENLRQTDHLEGEGIAGKMKLKCIFKKYNGVCGLD